MTSVQRTIDSTAKAAKAKATAINNAVHRITSPPDFTNVKIDMKGAEAKAKVNAAFERHAASREELLSSLKVPSGTRLLVSVVAGIISYASTLYFAAPLIELVVVGAIALTGLPFIGFLVHVLGLFAAVMASIYAGWKTMTFVMSFDIDEARNTAATLRDAAKRRVSLVRGWFKPAAADVGAAGNV
jgi:hypothetical protein